MFDRLMALDQRVFKRLPVDTAPGRSTDSPPDARRWREPPIFYWKHTWGRGDVLAAILVIGGIFNVVRSIAGSHFVSAAEWSAAPLAGVCLFLLLSLMPD
jgi:hypothetical protein